MKTAEEMKITTGEIFRNSVTGETTTDFWQASEWQRTQLVMIETWIDGVLRIEW